MKFHATHRLHKAPVTTRCKSVVCNVASVGKTSTVFVDKNGKSIESMGWDYGFRTGGGRLYMDHYGEVPQSVLEMAKANFQEELNALRLSVRYPLVEEAPGNPVGKAISTIGKGMIAGLAKLDVVLENNKVLSTLEPSEEPSDQECRQLSAQLAKLTIDNDAVMRREQARVAIQGELESPQWVKLPFVALCAVLDVLYDKKPIQKFWVLETVARIPYFAYISILHLYESVGFWRAGAELRKIHFAEEWNEMHHLQIMESLGGDRKWFDRFVADHSAILYYWLLIAFYLVSPKLAYNFMQRVELHAYDTYCEFVDANKELLQSLAPPAVALQYYLNQDLYLFDEFQQGSKANPRRPDCSSLYDVFCNIRDDEAEHVKTMIACQDETIAKSLADAKKE